MALLHAVPGTPGQAPPLPSRELPSSRRGWKEARLMMTNYAHEDYWLRPTRTPTTPPGLLPLPPSAEGPTCHARFPGYNVEIGVPTLTYARIRAPYRIVSQIKMCRSSKTRRYDHETPTNIQTGPRCPWSCWLRRHRWFRQRV